jgi:hypothetical protein
VMTTTHFGRYERKKWICGRVGLPRGDLMTVGWEVTLKVVLGTASRPNIICRSLSDAVVFVVSAFQRERRTKGVRPSHVVLIYCV